MTKQEQIEEMRKEIEKGFREADCRQPYTNEPYPYFETQKTAIAKALYDAGYRKVEEDIKQLKTECALLDDELRIARQETINVLNKLKEKFFGMANGWIFMDCVDEMIKELMKE